MKSGYWDNLRPFEKRVVVAVAALFFIVLNFVFVFPYFKEWNRVDDRMFQARRKLNMYNLEISKTNAYWVEVQKMEKQAGQVAPEDQIRHFNSTIDLQAGKSGVNMISGGSARTSTNQFFIEQSRSIGTQSREEPLVDFLYNLGSGDSLIRVRDLNLRPDPARQQIVANIALVASYQKKLAVKPAAPAAKAPASSPTASVRAPGNQPAVPNKK